MSATWSLFPIITTISLALITSVSIYFKGVLKVISIVILVLLTLFEIDLSNYKLYLNTRILLHTSQITNRKVEGVVMIRRL